MKTKIEKRSREAISKLHPVIREEADEIYTLLSELLKGVGVPGFSRADFPFSKNFEPARSANPGIYALRERGLAFLFEVVVPSKKLDSLNVLFDSTPDAEEIFMVLLDPHIQFIESYGWKMAGEDNYFGGIWFTKDLADQGISFT